MVTLRFFLLSLVYILFTTPAYLKADEGRDSPLGFRFGISRKEALKIIESHGNEIVKKTVDSKKIRTIVIKGAIIELPLNGGDFETSLEFFDDKLMSSSLVFKVDDPSKREKLKSELSGFLIDRYGEPGDKEDTLGLTVWTWHVPDLKIVLSTNPANNLTKVEYTYKPLDETMVQKEIEKEHRGKQTDPAKEMFIDGSYSRPPQYR